MRRVIVRFACPPNGLVRRRAKTVGATMKDGESKSFILEGYLCTMRGRNGETIAYVIDPPVQLFGVSAGVFRNSSNAPLGNLAAGIRNDYVPRTEPMPRDEALSAKYSSMKFNGRVLPVGSVGTFFRHTAMPPVRDGNNILFTRTLLSQEALDPMLGGSNGKVARSSFVYRGRSKLNLILDDSWLVAEFGDRTTFATVYSTIAEPDPVDMPEPHVFEVPVYFPTFDSPAPRQVSMPGVCHVSTDDSSAYFVAAVPIATMPIDQLVFYNTDIPPAVDERWDVRDPENQRAAVPSLLILDTPSKVAETQEEIDDLGLFWSEADASPSWATVTGGDAPAEARYFDPTAIEVPIDDWPAFFQQTDINYAVVMLDRTTPADLSGTPNKWPVTIGAIHATRIDNIVEFWMQVRATDEHNVTMTRDYRSNLADPLNPGDYAAIRYNRMGIMKVTFDTVSKAVSTESVYEDVMASTACPDFGGSMDSSYAYMTQVLWGGVLDGKRCYAVRALRYVRDIWLGALSQNLDANTGPLFPGDYRGFTLNYMGYTGADSAPMYYTDKGFGPYIDTTAPEELWWYVDGVKQVVTPPAGHRFAVRHRYGTIATVSSTMVLTPWVSRGWLSSMNLRPESNANQLAREYACDEYFPPTIIQQQFAQIAEHKVAYFIPEIEDQDGTLQLRVFDAIAGTDVVFATVYTPWRNGIEYFDFDSEYPTYALTCYQWETEEEGDIVTPACFFLKVSSGNVGYVLQSRDGGATWIPLIDTQTSFPAGENPGLSGFGYQFYGTPLWRAPYPRPFTKALGE